MEGRAATSRGRHIEIGELGAGVIERLVPRGRLVWRLVREARAGNVAQICALPLDQVLVERVVPATQASARGHWDVVGLLLDAPQHLLVGELLLQAEGPGLAVHACFIH